MKAPELAPTDPTSEELPDVDLPVPAEPGNREHGISKKGAALTAAGALLVSGIAAEAAQAKSDAVHGPAKAGLVQDTGGIPISSGNILKTGSVSAAELLGFRAGTASPDKLKIAETDIRGSTYTAKYIEGMEKGTIPFGYFNGRVIIDAHAHIYKTMDSSFLTGTKPGSSESLWPWWHANQPPGNSPSKGLFGSASRPVVTFDNKGNTWLLLSIESVNQFDGSPHEQASEYYTFFIPINKENAGHVKLYSYGQKPEFMAGAIDQDLNFISTTPGVEIDSSALAEWETSKVIKTANGPMHWAGTAKMPAMEPLAHLKDYTAPGGKPLKQITLPNRKTITKLVIQAHPGYGG